MSVTAAPSFSLCRAESKMRSKKRGRKKEGKEGVGLLKGEEEKGGADGVGGKRKT